MLQKHGFIAVFLEVDKQPLWWFIRVMDIHMSFIVHFDWMESSEGKAAIKKS